ncbi:Uncharacterized conserved protein, DUF2236 family [Amycolatopsis xylanica]|uniref:Uncharacterized conserved protein, DUF2236 family n=1 Tax=Amycolatopsis xylanica TaxID=589385 RepID=A0A1H3N9W8_9PSEU|nr:oxygenase MpaB family protein [Amycolatopsis xylanica]SDY85682.1 Uncharacterized conserved protein, DUF2236 family [Amycolatopsis xylanica]
MDVTCRPLGPGSVAWRLGGERRALLAGGYGLLLQVGHPVVGAGVLEHSNFQAEPWERLDRTMTSLLTTIYGGQAALDEAARLRELHKSIKGVDNRGRRYHALSQEAYWWVHATLFQGFVELERHFGVPLGDADVRTLYREWRQLGEVLGIKADRMPETVEGFREYFDDVVENRLEDNQSVRDVLHAISMTDVGPPHRLVPSPVWNLVRPLGGTVQRTCTIGLLPVTLRERWGLSWTVTDQKRFDRLASAVRVVGPRVPARIGEYRIAYDAKRRARLTG